MLNNLEEKNRREPFKRNAQLEGLLYRLNDGLQEAEKYFLDLLS